MAMSACAGVTTPPIVCMPSCCTTPSTGAVSFCRLVRCSALMTSCARPAAFCSALASSSKSPRSYSANRTRQAEQQVFSARETLRTTEQNTLLNAATAYMNLLQTAAILELQRSNVNVLEVTLRQTRDRFTAGEVTRTDVAQAESRLASGRSQLSQAESNYVTAQAQYLQVVGVPPPPRLAAAAPVDRLSPRTLDGAIARGRTEHPLITTAMYNVDIAVQQVKIAEGAL